MARSFVSAHTGRRGAPPLPPTAAAQGQDHRLAHAQVLVLIKQEDKAFAAQKT
jgi:hypothetical protein